MGAMPVVVFADGAAKGNPGPGGWGAIVVTPDGHVTELGGGAGHTTNNRMELSAGIEALRHVGPTSGPVGTVVTITGSGLTGATKVSFGGVKATSYAVDSGTQIHATVPVGAKTGPIAVSTAGGNSPAIRRKGY